MLASSSYTSELHRLFNCRKPHRKGLNPTYFAAPQPGQAGNEQFFYFTNLVRTADTTACCAETTVYLATVFIRAESCMFSIQPVACAGIVLVQKPSAAASCD